MKPKSADFSTEAGRGQENCYRNHDHAQTPTPSLRLEQSNPPPHLTLLMPGAHCPRKGSHQCYDGVRQKRSIAPTREGQHASNSTGDGGVDDTVHTDLTEGRIDLGRCAQHEVAMVPAQEAVKYPFDMGEGHKGGGKPHAHQVQK
jgi:hypothetical protein